MPYNQPKNHINTVGKIGNLPFSTGSDRIFRPVMPVQKAVETVNKFNAYERFPHVMETKNAEFMHWICFFYIKNPV